jgi:hypothetical protein
MYIDQTNQTKMTKATTRPTIQTRYTAQVKADRRAAALERRQNDYRQDAGFVAIYTQKVGA